MNHNARLDRLEKRAGGSDDRWRILVTDGEGIILEGPDAGRHESDVPHGQVIVNEGPDLEPV